MIVREHEVPVGSGTVIVRDYGGDGPDVLLVHAPGFCSMAWESVAGALGGQVHAYAIDLPGHGGSSAAMKRPADAWTSVVAVAEHLGLHRPLLVGASQASHTCLAATLTAPGVFAGVIALGGACVRSVDSAADDITFYTSPEFTELLRQRFFFGFRGETEADKDALIDRMIARLGRDWRVTGYKGLPDETRYSIRPHPDGGWVNLPLPSTLTTMLSLTPEDRLHPDDRLYDRIDVPVVVVQLSDGLDQEYAQRERDLAVTHPLVSVRGLDAGDYPHYTRPHEVAGIILESCGLTARPVMDAPPFRHLDVV